MICICCSDDIERLDFLKKRTPPLSFNMIISHPSELTMLCDNENTAVIYILFSKPYAFEIQSRNCAVIMPFELVSHMVTEKMSGIPLITYGISPRATIGYSSNTGDGLLISLQRSIKAFSGRIIEPMEMMACQDRSLSTENALIEAAATLLMQ